ncbi:MAG TPA: glutamine synthetase III [Treponemataceae bacterium]|nr:glutamine synthetase III [Treponemataceae bacterium]HQB89081.1 glutamine synthetase III [Treponemataceae bacterium]
MPFNDIYGINAFGDSVMRDRLPKAIYKELKSVQAGECELTNACAEVVANAMKDWAIEKGCTHYTHWFQPMTGLTAEKHDSFISPTEDGLAIVEFSGKELIQGEPDASSFPSGGLRATFEARGYTAWDVTSPAFITEEGNCKTLVIPTAFVGYHGEALDKKTPLLRSMQALSDQAVRVLRALGNTSSKRVISTVGPEQEYFLVDRELYQARQDLIFTGRTLFGSLPPKGQELEDHYFGKIPERVSAFMTDVNLELWKIGIPSKTQHNEVAPNQFELAPIFGFSNVATDHNQMVMQTLKRVAKHHGLECLLHEKPFKGVNGSGKHNNWSMGTDDGLNLLNPGSTPCENLSFLVFVAAVIKAVDTYAPLLRLAAANAGNDHRLGANEAPPAIISIFLGDQLQDIFESVATGKPLAHGSNGRLELGVNTLPKLPQDLTDRNRTSPFAFTGNKFEFRMCPSSDSISGPNFVINTIVAEVLDDIAGTLEKAKDLNKAAHDLIVDVWKKHSKVIFNGNGYTDEWVKEAEKRGLPNLRSSVEAWPYFASDESVRIFTKHKIFTKEEIHARLDIVLEKYSKQINIEAACAHEIATREILPACTEYAVELASQIAVLEEAGMKALSLKKKLSDITALVEEASALADELEKARLGAHTVDGCLKEAEYYRDQVFSKAEALRVPVDMLEKLMPKDFWPMPTYEDLLFRM